jgi:predicted permease
VSIRRLFQLPLHRRERALRDLDEEIRTHLEMRADWLVAHGWPADAARQEAMRRFGDLEPARHRLRSGAQRREARMLRSDRLDALRHDLAYALRQMRRAPGFTAAIVATFALAIGANATMFGILDRLLLRPPAFLADPARTHRIYQVTRSTEGADDFRTNTSYKRYLELRQALGDLGESATFFDAELVVGRGEDARELRTGLVSASFWKIFDAPPVLGRVFGAAEDSTPGGQPVAVLGYGFWQSRFGGARDVLGKTLDIGGRQYTIVGVAPRGLSGMWVEQIAAFIPVTAAAFDMFGERYYTTHNIGWVEMLVRRAPGVTPAQIETRLTTALAQSYAAESAGRSRGRPVAELHPRVMLGSVLADRGPNRSQSASVATWLGGVAMVVLLIACANVANLLLARARRRSREIAVRIALGIGRARLVGQLLTESVLLGLLGGAAGLAVAYWGGNILRATLLPNVDWTGSTLDLRLLVATTGFAVLAGILAGLAPAVQASNADVAGALKAGGREGSLHRSRTRTALLVLQVGMSAVLLIGAGLFLRSLTNVRDLRLGFDVDNVLYLSFERRGEQMSDSTKTLLAERMRERAAALPVVSGAAITSTVPFWMRWNEDLYVTGIDSVSKLGDFTLNAVSPEYFRTVGTRILRGRGFEPTDRKGAPPVAVVSEGMARVIWPGTDALGQCFRVGADTSPCTTVVGIAEETRTGSLEDSGEYEYYLAADQRDRKEAIFVRTTGPAAAQMEPIRRELQRLMPGTAFVTARTMVDVMAREIRPWRLGATMFTVFGGLALVLASVGLYGVIAFNVVQRLHELGVRVALGARTTDIIRLVLAEGVRVVLVGIVLGVGIALLTGRYVSSLLFHVSPRDPWVLGAVGAALLVVAVGASLVPALRASRVDPNLALRAD